MIVLTLDIFQDVNKHIIGALKLINNMRKRYEIINHLINKYGYTRYLEIGAGKGHNFNKINCPVKHCIDPEYPSTFVMTSDKFFKELDDSEKYDIIFVDGDHSKRAVTRDINNSLEHLSDDGIILVHDMNPTSHKVAKKHPKEGRATWYGDGYKYLIILRATDPFLVVRTIDTDCGIGIIKRTKKKQTLIDMPEKLGYKYMDSDRKYFIGLISVEEFLEMDL